MLLILFIIPVLTLVLINLIKYFDFKNEYVSFVKNLTLASLFISCVLSILVWKGVLTSGLNLYINSFLAFSCDYTLSLIFIILSIFILVVSALTAYNTGQNVAFICNSLLFLEVFLLGAFSCNSILLFLVLFEASALPIFLLIVRYGSVRKERVKASFYFLLFTVYGSLSILLFIINLYMLYQTEYTLNSYFTSSHVSWLLLFVSFAVKVPLFPFHTWLPYAHVEASTMASIILAAVLLKLGGYGLIKFLLPAFNFDVHVYFQPLVMLISLVGVIYAGLCALRQVDLKRMIAFSSISHMSLAIAGIFTFSDSGIIGSIYLMVSHGLVSAAMFFLAGVLSDRYHTRSIDVFSGLWGTMPMFSFFWVFVGLANVGFPGTSGFIPEFMLINSIINFSPVLGLFLFFGLVIVTSFFLVFNMRMLYGSSKLTAYTWSDLTKIEFFVLAVLSFGILILGLFVIF